MSVNNDSEAGTMFLGIIFAAAVMCSAYFLFQTASYELFFEDKIIETIKETVVKGCLL